MADKAKKPDGRRNNGRPKGSKNKRTERLEKQVSKIVAEKAEGKLLPQDYLLGVLRGEMAPDKVRIEVAVALLPYNLPKLSSITVDGKLDVNAHEARVLALAAGPVDGRV